MKNKKGFTLIEIITVISILSCITLLGSISFHNVTEKEKQLNIEKTKELIITATDVYLNQNSFILESLYNELNGEEICTMIIKLQDEGLLKDDIKNPKTNRLIEGNTCVYTKVGPDGTLVHRFDY